MKLQARFSRITIISTLFILLVTAASYYFLLHYVLIGEMDEELKEEEQEVYDYVKKYDKLPEPSVYKDQRITFEKTNEPVKRSFSSVEIYNANEKEDEVSRQLLFPVNLHSENYIFSVTKSEEATEGLIWMILLSTVGLIVLLTAILFFTNRFLIKKLWRPFYATLSSIKDFNLSAPVELKMQPTNITEFKELNESIRMMTFKVMKDYQSLKNYTNHASHEMQTPLAIINSKLDILIQEPELSEKSMLQVQSIYKSVEKLSRLCQSLLLLARIENSQYTDTQVVFINELVKEKSKEFEEWITARQLTLDMQLDPLQVTMNKDLAEMLIGNLIRNAVRHNEINGAIVIQTGENKLTISNSGSSPLDNSKIFDRFYKSEHSDGSGIGLAIVKQICEQYHFRPAYFFSQGQHYFTILFGPL